jgi:hypothetical protein
MPKVIPSRMAAEMEGEFVVFLIGLRINKPWKLHKWLPVFLAMPKMLKELQGHPESGFLGHNGAGSPSCSTGAPSSISKPTRVRKTSSIGRHGSISTAGSAAAEATSASGTKRTSSSPATTKRYTAECRPTVWAKPASLFQQMERSKRLALE